MSQATFLANAPSPSSLAAPPGAGSVGAATAAAATLATTASAAAVGPASAARRVIRTADVSIETDAPEEASRKLVALAETSGGFVVTSDTAQERAENGEQRTTVTVVFRVPSPEFERALGAVRALGKRVESEKVSGQDVTEEYVDIEARLVAQRAIEAQYLAILKLAKTIPDTIEVEQKLGEVRTEIERAEGRRRFLDTQTAFSTLTVRFAKHVGAVQASGPGFGRAFKEAATDAVDVSVAILTGTIRAAGILTPMAVLVALPAWAVFWLASRRRRKRVAPSPAPAAA